MARTTAAHALRNPGRRVQLSRPRTSKSKAVRASDDLRLASSRRVRTEFNAAIDTEFTRRETVIMEIASMSNKKATYVRALLNSTSQFKAKRAPTLRNALLHQRWIDRPEDSKKKLQEYREELAEDERLGLIDLGTIDEKEKERLLEQLMEHRKLKRTGIRGSTKAAQLDSRATACRVGIVIRDLYERTGVRALAVFARGDPDDMSLPHSVDSDDASGFYRQVLGMTEVEFLRKFEEYNCTRDKGGEKNGVREMRRDNGMKIQEGLRKITNSSKLTMEYLNYDVTIREGRGVELAGWPVDIKMADHVNWNAETLRRIRDALRTGAIHWVAMPKAQHDELIAMHNARREALGAGSLRSRKPRADKGLPRGPQKNKKSGRKGSKRQEQDDDEGEDDENEEEEDDEDDTATPATTTTQPAPAAGVCATTALAAPPTHNPGTAISAFGDPEHVLPPFDMSAHPELHILPEHLPRLSTSLTTGAFELDPELMEMLNDPDAWMDEDLVLPTDPESRAFAASFSLNPIYTSTIPAFATTPSSAALPQHDERQVLTLAVSTASNTVAITSKRAAASQEHSDELLYR
ncbi:hypothetical protein C8F04DRAFT_1324250 [Mycena alexandri]|uniref:Uncharacterized protein n=1 Tax=Mycena alexandri TaxID=1745969 RepID=A0AAD6S0V5_9AGAR|nr:hypothetical protein C8F04DRAFT_1324250 [Mycena alexandri]